MDVFCIICTLVRESFVAGMFKGCPYFGLNPLPHWNVSDTAGQGRFLIIPIKGSMLMVPLMIPWFSSLGEANEVLLHDNSTPEQRAQSANEKA